MTQNAAPKRGRSSRFVNAQGTARQSGRQRINVNGVRSQEEHVQTDASSASDDHDDCLNDDSEDDGED